MRDKSRRKQSEAARRKKRTKVHEYGRLPGVQVALFVCHNGRYFTYRSVGKASLAAIDRRNSKWDIEQGGNIKLILL